jgi:hypothetical protein
MIEYPWRFVCQDTGCTYSEVQQLTDSAAVKIIGLMQQGLVSTHHIRGEHKTPCGPVVLEHVRLAA